MPPRADVPQLMLNNFVRTGVIFGRPCVGCEHHSAIGRSTSCIVPSDTLDELRARLERRLATFAFDPARQAVILVAGDKSVGSETRFYRSLTAAADKRFDDHLARQK